MQSNITVDEIVKADVFLKQFVAETEFLYSEDAMTFNVHQLLHISQSVADWGPLWAHSGYPFESGHGQIINNVYAAKGVISQICRNLSVKKSLIIMEKHVTRKEDSPVTDYCDYLENRCTVETLKLGNYRYFTKSKTPNIENLEGLNLSGNRIRTFGKLVKNACVFKSCRKVLKRSDNSFVLLENGEYIQIVDFIVDIDNNMEYTLCKKVEIQNSLDYTHMHVKEIVRLSNEISVIPRQHRQFLKNS